MKTTKILLWAASVFFLAGCFAYLTAAPIASIISLFIAAAVNPALAKKIIIPKKIKIPVCMILFLLMIAAVPAKEQALRSVNAQNTASAHRDVKNAVPTSAAVLPLSSEKPIPNESASENDLTVHFLDVGQGLSILCESGGRYLLYDGGDRDHSSFVVSYLKKQGVDTLDYVIASHYDADHLSGVIGALNAFQIGMVLGPDYIHDSKLYQSFISKTAEIGKPVEHPFVHGAYRLGNSEFEILAPFNIVDDSNNNSIVIKLTCGKTSFIFTGDAEYEEEHDMTEGNAELSCDVLSVSHHGSATSTSWEFLQKTLPDFAVISCGKDNSYGHPDADTMEKLQSAEVKIFRTDEQGTIVARTDGRTLAWSTEPSENYGGGTGGKDIVIRESESAAAGQPASQETSATYVLNKSSKKFHKPDCKSAKQIKESNYVEYTGDREELIANGYQACKICKP